MCFYRNFVMPKQATKQHLIGSAVGFSATLFSAFHMLKYPSPNKNTQVNRFNIKY